TLVARAAGRVELPQERLPRLQPAERDLGRQPTDAGQRKSAIGLHAGIWVARIRLGEIIVVREIRPFPFELDPERVIRSAQTMAVRAGVAIAEAVARAQHPGQADV